MLLAATMLVAASMATAGDAASATAPAGVATRASTGADGHAAPSRAKRGAELTTSAQEVDEGERVTLTARVRAASRARTITLQRWVVPAYYGTPEWESVRTRSVKGKRKVRFHVVATALDSERYRVRVTYRNARPVTSKPARVTVWRWIELRELHPYYETGGLLFGEATLNGRRYQAYGAAAYSHARSWEGRFTPGRHCKAFRGVLGVADISDDGSSGSIELTAEDAPIYRSPVLTPGMAVRVTVPLRLVYRFGIQLYDTSPDTVESWPVIGEPALLCTDI